MEELSDDELFAHGSRSPVGMLELDAELNAFYGEDEIANEGACNEVTTGGDMVELAEAEQAQMDCGEDEPSSRNNIAQPGDMVVDEVQDDTQEAPEEAPMEGAGLIATTRESFNTTSQVTAAQEEDVLQQEEQQDLAPDAEVDIDWAVYYAAMGMGPHAGGLDNFLESLRHVNSGGEVELHDDPDQPPTQPHLTYRPNFYQALTVNHPVTSLEVPPAQFHSSNPPIVNSHSGLEQIHFTGNTLQASPLDISLDSARSHSGVQNFTLPPIATFETSSPQPSLEIPEARPFISTPILGLSAPSAHDSAGSQLPSTDTFDLPEPRLGVTSLPVRSPAAPPPPLPLLTLDVTERSTDFEQLAESNTHKEELAAPLAGDGASREDHVTSQPPPQPQTPPPNVLPDDDMPYNEGRESMKREMYAEDVRQPADVTPVTPPRLQREDFEQYGSTYPRDTGLVSPIDESTFPDISDLDLAVTAPPVEAPAQYANVLWLGDAAQDSGLANDFTRPEPSATPFQHGSEVPQTRRERSEAVDSMLNDTTVGSTVAMDEDVLEVKMEDFGELPDAPAIVPGVQEVGHGEQAGDLEESAEQPVTEQPKASVVETDLGESIQDEPAEDVEVMEEQPNALIVDQKLERASPHEPTEDMEVAEEQSSAPAVDQDLQNASPDEAAEGLEATGGRLSVPGVDDARAVATLDEPVEVTDHVEGQPATRLMEEEEATRESAERNLSAPKENDALMTEAEQQDTTGGLNASENSTAEPDAELSQTDQVRASAIPSKRKTTNAAAVQDESASDSRTKRRKFALENVVQEEVDDGSSAEPAQEDLPSQPPTKPKRMGNELKGLTDAWSGANDQPPQSRRARRGQQDSEAAVPTINDTKTTDVKSVVNASSVDKDSTAQPSAPKRGRGTHPLGRNELALLQTGSKARTSLGSATPSSVKNDDAASDAASLSAASKSKRPTGSKPLGKRELDLLQDAWSPAPQSQRSKTTEGRRTRAQDEKAAEMQRTVGETVKARRQGKGK